MDLKLLHRIYAACVFLVTLIIYWMTVQPTVSFWDCGEFIAASYYLQVPHPPGAPFFLLLGNVFSKIPFLENVGFKINLISVFSSALAVFFLYLIAVKLINIFKSKGPDNLFDGIATYTAAAIGALSLAFSDTYWFNAVEAEVYAFSTLLVAAITYLILRWYERADNKESEKYILAIAYLVGLSMGVHLMSVLTIVPVTMVICFRKYLDDEDALKRTGVILLVHAGIILLISLIWWSGETGTTSPTNEQYKDFDSKFKLMAAGISAIIMGIFWRKIFNKNSFYLPMIIGGLALFATYPGVVKFLPSIMTSIGKENIIVEIVLFILFLGLLGYAVNYSIKKNKPTLHMVFMSGIFILVGFTTFSMVIIRANQYPPMNENEPVTFPKLEKYLNREQYGDFPTFKRRFSGEPHQQGVYTNYPTDLSFFYNYQMNHMMTRYLLWNYAGREGWVQDDGANIAPLNGIGNIFGKVFNIKFEGNVGDSLFGIPFLIGLFGIYYHFRKDWKLASVFMVMFILLGYLTAFYQNQQQPQPRERDYFYVGAFFVFSIWIAIGIRGLFDLVKEKTKDRSYSNTIAAGVLIFGLILIPINMIRANYFTHDRSRNWVPWDYSYNILQSTGPGGVLFTNGDNDTFPLWYLQDVEGVRRDVKVVNLSLLNTDWYVRQLKNNDPYGVGTLKIRIPDARINEVDLRPAQWSPADVTISAPKPGNNKEFSEIVNKYSIKDTTIIKSGKMTWKMPNTLTFGEVKAIRVQDIMVKEIIEANNWERPIYFAVTCSDDSKIGLQEYLKMEGMTFKLVPEKRTPGREFVNEELLQEQLSGNTISSVDFKPGFRFTGLNDPTIFFDENHKRMIQNYRNAFMRLAVFYKSSGNNQGVVSTLNDMNEKLPYKNLGMDNGLLFEVANLYLESGDKNKFAEISVDVEKRALEELEENPEDVNSYYNPYRLLIETYEKTEQFDKLLGLWQRLETMFPNDPTVKSNIQRYQELTQQKDTTAN
ncbi:MAG: protein O-mannosyl-transferase family [Ignavibacteriales bacterium]